MTHLLLNPWKNWKNVQDWDSSYDAVRRKQAAVREIWASYAHSHSMDEEATKRTIDVGLTRLASNGNVMFYANPLSWVEREYQLRRTSPMEFFMPGGCHHIVRLQKKLAQLCYPERTWYIKRGKQHSCVWDGSYLIFDIISWYLGITGDSAYSWVTKGIHPSQLQSHFEMERRRLFRLELEARDISVNSIKTAQFAAQVPS